MKKWNELDLMPEDIRGLATGPITASRKKPIIAKKKKNETD
jgi:hypothetical protein